jgi:hypothetical protein
MHRQHHRDRRHDLGRHLDVHLQKEHHRQSFYMDLNYLHQLMVHLFVVGNFLMRVDAVKMVALQNLDALNLGVVLTFLDEENLVHYLQVVVVDVELRHQLKMDCYLDEVDEELHY